MLGSVGGGGARNVPLANNQDGCRYLHYIVKTFLKKRKSFFGCSLDKLYNPGSGSAKPMRPVVGLCVRVCLRVAVML